MSNICLTKNIEKVIIDENGVTIYHNGGNNIILDNKSLAGIIDGLQAVKKEEKWSVV